MAIVSVPPSAPQPKTCAICGVSLTPDKATAGMLDGRGSQAYACVSHFMEVEKLITGWADFAAKERYKLPYHDQGLQELLNETGEHHA